MNHDRLDVLAAIVPKPQREYQRTTVPAARRAGPIAISIEELRGGSDHVATPFHPAWPPRALIHREKSTPWFPGRRDAHSPSPPGGAFLK